MRLTRIFAGAALAASLMAGPALADPAPSPGSAERLQLAQQLMELSGGEKAVDQRIEATLASSSKLVAMNTPPEGAKFALAIQRDMRDEMLKMAPSLIDITVHAYADNLTTQQLRDYVAWLSSDSGRAITAKMPAVQQQVLDRAAPMMGQFLDALGRRVSDRVCEDLHCTAGERKLVAQVLAKALPSRS